jgi:CCR4-NOT transcription complex subunit 6
LPRALHNREPTLTTRTSSFSGCLDYIWVSKQGLQVTGTLRMPYSEPAGPPGGPEGVSAAAMGACPNAAQPSDHLAVGCEVALLV